MDRDCPITTHPVGLVWQILLTDLFSTLARLERLANCRDAATRRYYHIGLAGHIDEGEIGPTLRDCHRLIWREWMRRTLEQQHGDLVLYLSQAPIHTVQLARRGQAQPSFLDWPPDSADQLERALFRSNLSVLLDLEARLAAPAQQPTPTDLRETALIGKAIRLAQDNYFHAEFTLTKLAHRLHISRRYLGRLFQHSSGKTFRQYIRDLRMQQAAHLLAAGERSDIKAVLAMVGYSSRSHFDQDFREHFGCTPSQFQAAKQ